MCHKLLSTRSNLKIHVADKHSTLQHAFPCPVCGNIYKTRNSLHNHLSIRHRGVRMPRHPGVPAASRPRYESPRVVHTSEFSRPEPLHAMLGRTPVQSSSMPLELTTSRTHAPLPYISPSSDPPHPPPPHLASPTTVTHPSRALIHPREDLLPRRHHRTPPTS
ncbi:hypothetical protein HAZT_HAZT007191 [Hyalella azteca]|nr:hypothetical protein HAZT_HAZT007191 [Hyalella azteca]